MDKKLEDMGGVNCALPSPNQPPPMSAAPSLVSNVDSIGHQIELTWTTAHRLNGIVNELRDRLSPFMSPERPDKPVEAVENPNVPVSDELFRMRSNMETSIRLLNDIIERVEV